jgi:hypothetical protein
MRGHPNGIEGGRILYGRIYVKREKRELRGHLQGSLFQPLAAQLSFFTKRELRGYAAACRQNL